MKRGFLLLGGHIIYFAYKLEFQEWMKEEKGPEY